MDAVLKSKWVDALRSGKYEQGRSRLYDRHLDQFCCLGVLCKVAGLEISDYGNGVVGAAVEDDYTPIYDLLGDPNIATQLWRRNDGNAKPRETFPQIADYIEQNL